MTDIPVFDHAWFDTYTTADEPLQREVMLLFFGQIETLVGNFMPSGSGQDWYAAAHAIKGGARGVGLAAVGDLCAKMEERKDADAPSRQKDLDALIAALGAARASVAAHYEGIFDI